MVLVTVGVSAASVAARSDHGNPDPGGHVLAALKTVERAVPANAQVMLRQANEPGWDSCDGRTGAFGWDDVTVGVQFRTIAAPHRLVSEADAALHAAGWQRTATLNTPLGPGACWSRMVAARPWRSPLSRRAPAGTAPAPTGTSMQWRRRRACG